MKPGQHVLICLMTVWVSSLLAETDNKNQEKNQEKNQTLVITARRVATDSVAVISNIDKITSEKLQTVSHNHIQEILLSVAGINLQRGNGQEYLPAIRSPVLTGPGACGAFLIAEDNIPLRPSGFCNINELFEAHSEQASAIEVIKGPGSAFQGSNALHGIINILTPEIPDSAKSAFSFEMGSYDYARIKTSVGDGDDKQGYHLALTMNHDGGYRSQSGLEQQKFSARHLYSTTTMRVISGFTATHLRQETAGFIVGKDSYRDRELARSNLNPEAYRNADAFRLWSRIKYQNSKENYLLITPYIRVTDMAFMQHFLPGKPLEENATRSLGFQSSYSSTINNLTLAIGLDGELTEAYLKQTQQSPTTGSVFLQETIPVGKQYDYAVDAKMFAPFVHMDWRFSDKWQISSGLRFEHINYDYNNKMLSGRSRDDGTYCSFGGCRYSRPEDSRDVFENASPKLGIGYQYQKNALAFINLSHGFRAPQTTELYRLQRQQEIADLDSVEANSIELGIRKQTSALNYELVYYLMNKDNVIYRDSNFFNISNGKTKHQGIELAIDYSINEAVTIELNLSMAKHIYDYNQLISGINIYGNDVDTAPRHFGSSQINWEISDDMQLQFEWIHQGSYYMDAENLHRYQGHNLFNLRYGWSLADNWKLSLRLNNLTDEKYADRADYTSFTKERYFPGMPRTLFLGILWQG